VRLDELATLLVLPELEHDVAIAEERLLAALGRAAEPQLRTASLRVATVSGKRLRPVFTVAAARVAGAKDLDRVHAASAAVELVQIGSLVHDDLFEEAGTRRGVPTVNATEGKTAALLAGNFILAAAASEAALSGQRVARMLAQTVAALCEGQVAEMRDQFNPDRTVDDYLRSIRGKTGVLFAAACRAGAYCADAPDEVVESFGRFGEEFGMAFQLLDDVLDFVADPDRLGKPTGIDLATGVYTLPVILARELRTGPALRVQLARRGDADLALVRSLITDAGTLSATLAEASRFAASASGSIEHLEGDVAAGLRALARTYVGWAVEHFTTPAGQVGLI